MEDQTPNVGNAGAEGTPNPPVSQTPIDGTDKLLSAFESRIENLTKEIRGLQSRQDKTSNDFLGRLAKLEQYEKQGLTREQAISRMETDEQETSWRKNLEDRLNQIAAQLGSGGTQTSGQQKVEEVFTSKGLDPKDPRIAPFLVKQYENKEAMELTAYRLRDELASAPNPTPAQQASLTGGNTGSVNAQEALSTLQNLYKNYSQNKTQIESLERELKAAGHI